MDVSSKWVLGGSPDLWVRWVLNDPTLEVEELLDAEFQFVGRASDSLLRVRGTEGFFLVLTEVQLRADPRMPRRIRAYAALAEEKYDLPVYPVVLCLLPSPTGDQIPDQFHSEFRGLVAHQDFRVLKTWQLDADEILRQEVVPLIPYVPLMQGGDEAAIRTAARLLQRQTEEEPLQMVLALFASFVLDVTTVQQIVRWNMPALRESPLYQEILQQGMQQGLQQGMQQGLQQGMQQGLQQGMQQGLQQGILQGHRRAILGLLRARLDLSATDLEGVARRLDRIEGEGSLQALVVEASRVNNLKEFQTALDKML